MPVFEEEKTVTSLGVAEAAMCAWECLIEDGCAWPDNQNEAFVPFWTFVKRVGMAQARWTILTVVAAKIDEDYQAAVAAGYDDPFDWEYVPAWLEKNIERVLPDNV